MIESPAISVRNVSKKYRLFGSIKERFFEALHPFNKKYHHEFWALRDMNFDVPKGSTMGIIGRNGSGKSTLLQIIASVLRPTSGDVEVNGKVSALLELGAGFNLELTGRENALFHGELMGFTRKEMLERLPVIEEFADIGEFIDQPVKIYSSGMFVRLAFAAAITVDPDILIIDEALAVGDARFQRKCFQKFHEFQQAGKTILFVSHDTSSIVKHCDRAILLEKGKMIEYGKPNDVVNHYGKMIHMDGVEPLKTDTVTKAPVSSNEGPTDDTGKHEKTELEKFLEDIPAEDRCKHRKSYNKNESRYGDRRAEIVDYLVVCNGLYDPTVIDSGDTIDVYIKAVFYEDVESLTVGFAIKTVDGVIIYGNNSRYMEVSFRPVKKPHLVILKFSIQLTLKAGDYFISFAVGEKDTASDTLNDSRSDIIHLSFREKDYFDGLVGLETEFEEISRTKMNTITRNHNVNNTSSI